MDEQKIKPKGSAHQDEIDRLDSLVDGGGKLDDVEEEQQGIQVKKAHKDLNTKYDESSDLLKMRLRDVTFPLSDPVRKDIEKTETLFQELVKAGIAAGLAGNQAHVTACVICVHIGPDNITMINPKIIGRSKQTKLGFEACLSIPGVAVRVRRPKSITVEYYDKDGDRHVYTPMLHKYARIIAHECDHTSGITLEDHVLPDGSNVRLNIEDWM